MLYYEHGTDRSALHILTHLILTQVCKKVSTVFPFKDEEADPREAK